jgi:hypothetical protein
MWLIDQVAAEMDSLYNKRCYISIPRDLILMTCFLNMVFVLILILSKTNKVAYKTGYRRARKCNTISKFNWKFAQVYPEGHRKNLGHQV